MQLKKCLTIEEKNRMIEEIQDGNAIHDVDKEYGVSRSQVYKMLKNTGSPPV